ncbi:hypothetical protein BGX30_010877 [Mortierella sp. GBA39]|nr:hypothetical protein BGX30_010877 [Mortierella sp. GBA39]
MTTPTTTTTPNNNSNNNNKNTGNTCDKPTTTIDPEKLFCDTSNPTSRLNAFANINNRSTNYNSRTLLSQQEKRLAEELEWLQKHQKKQAAVIERQRQAALLRGGQKAQAEGEGKGEIQQDDRSGLVKQGAPKGLSVQELWGRIPSTKNHVQPNERHQHQQQPQPQQQQRQPQPEVEESQHREKQGLWELYKLRKQQEQEIVERRQQLQQQQQQQQLQQAPLSNKLLQQPSAKKDEVYSELIKPGPPQGQESKSNKVLPRYNRPLIPAPLNWVQSTIDIDNNKQNGIEDSDDDEEVGFEGEDHRGHHYNQQAQCDWRGLRRLSKAYVPLPRRKRGRKGRGDFFEDDYHAGFNKIEIHALSSAGKAAYEAQRQNRQHHDAPPLPGAVIALEELE